VKRFPPGIFARGVGSRFGNRYVWVLKDPLSPVLHSSRIRIRILRSLGQVESLSRLAERYRAGSSRNVLTRVPPLGMASGFVGKRLGRFPNEASTEISTTLRTRRVETTARTPFAGINARTVLLGHTVSLHPAKTHSDPPTSFGSENRADTVHPREILIGVAKFHVLWL